MAQSVLVFVSHSSEDKNQYIQPIVADLEECYINVWIDKRRIVPGNNIRKSIFRDGLDKADIALLFFTESSLKSSWVDREIKHVLREEARKGNNFDLNKIISIFDSQETYKEISERYPELTDDLLHLMPKDYSSIHLGQLVSAIWSKYLSIQGGDVEVQRQLLVKEKEILQKDKEIHQLRINLQDEKSKDNNSSKIEEFEYIISSGILAEFILSKDEILGNAFLDRGEVPQYSEAVSFGLLDFNKENISFLRITNKGKEFFKWFLSQK